jgi:cytochrome c peroxidase
VPRPPRRSFDAAAAARGDALFNGKANCANCHAPPLYHTPGWNAVPASVIGIDDFQSSRSPNRAYRPPPLRGMFTRAKGGYFHDGRFATLGDVVAHFNTQFRLSLTAAEQRDLVEFLKSL